MTMSKSIELGPLLTIAESMALQEIFETKLRTAQEIEIDASAVTAADTAGMQLLLAFCQEAVSRGIEVTWLQTGTAIPRAAELLGLRQALELPKQQEAQQ